MEIGDQIIAGTGNGARLRILIKMAFLGYVPLVEDNLTYILSIVSEMEKELKEFKEKEQDDV